MSCGYSEMLSQRQCKIQLCMYRLGEQKVLESLFFELSKSLKSKIFHRWAPWCHLREKLTSLQTCRFELLGGWNV